jgi:plastocyanin
VQAFDTDCLAAPADTAFRIRFDNRDQDTHNVEILDQPGGTPLFEGEVFVGPKVVTYEIDPIGAGTYYFRCEIHPLQMNGTFIVGG